MAETAPDIVAKWTTLKETDLLKFLDQRHDDYASECKRTTYCLDVYSAERERLVTSTYLPKGNAEDNSDYEKRLELTEAIPETPKLVGKTAGAVFEPDPTHEVPDDMKEYLVNADRRNLTHVQIMFDLFSKALVCGKMVVFVDTTMRPEMNVRSKLEAQQVGARVILSTYDPRNILNWRYDDKDLDWIHLRDSETKQSSFFEEKKSYTVHRIITKEVILVARVFQDSGGTRRVERDDPLYHGMDEVPCRTLIFVHNKDKGVGVGKSAVQTTVRADLAALRADSGRAMILLIHGLPQLWRRFSDEEWKSVQNAYVTEMAAQGKSKAAGSIDYTYIGKKIKLGFTSYHLLKGDNSEIGYSTLDVGPIDKLKEASADYRKIAVDQAGFEAADIWGEQHRLGEQSGIHKALSYMMDLAPQLEYLSMVMSLFDTDLLKLVCRTAGANDSTAKASYPQPRIVAPFNALQEEYDFAVESNFPPEIIAKLKATIFNRMIAFDGLEPEEKNTFAKLIEDEHEKEQLSQELTGFEEEEPVAQET